MIKQLSKVQLGLLLCGLLIGCIMVLPFLISPVSNFSDGQTPMSEVWWRLQKPADVVWRCWTQKLRLPPYNEYAAWVLLPGICVFLQWSLPFVVIAWIAGRCKKSHTTAEK
jgi:hypothetical protein